jgi:cell division protein FtsN
MKGTYSSFAEAKSESQHVVDNGFPDAYVVAYLDGKHISLDKAKSTEAKQEGNTGSKTVSTNGSITFMVQIGAYREKLSTTEENKLKALYTPRNIEIKKSEDMNLYLVGNYKTYKEADYLKKKLINEGHEGVFVVAFNGEDKITVEHALKSNKNK